MLLLRVISKFFGAERAHNSALWLLRIADYIPFCKAILHKIYATDNPKYSREVFGLTFPNPIGVAAGFDRNGEVYRTLGAIGFGFVEIGTITPLAQSGNPKPRVFYLSQDGAILNRTGLQNRGLQQVIRNLRHGNKGVIIGCNIGKNTITPPEKAPADYLKVFRNLYQYVDYFTVNVSYNTTFAQYIPRTREAILSILEPLFDFRRGQNQYRPILLKISPDLSNEDIDMVTDIMIDTPLDGMVATTATIEPAKMQTDLSTPLYAAGGAFSGKPLHERAVDVVRRIHTRCKGTYPIIGVGGIDSASSARDFFDAGATLIQLYTGYVTKGPNLIKDILTKLDR